MSRSPTSSAPGQAAGDRAAYENAWVALNQLLREGGSLSGREAHCAYLNAGAGRFADVSSVSGLHLLDDGRAAAVVDWDLDGRLDLWLANRTAPAVRLMLNRGPAEHRWLAVKLAGTSSNRDAIGARVEVVLSGDGEDVRRFRTLRAGEGYLAQSSKWLHFGLGDEAELGALERVSVHWPAPHGDTAPVEEFDGLTVNGRFVLTQGGGRALPWSPPRPTPSIPPATLSAPPTTQRARIAFATPVVLPTLPYLDARGRPAGLGGSADRPRLVNLWAAWCAPCVDELGTLARRRDELADAGLDLLALNVEQPEAAAGANALLDDLDWPFARGRSTTELLQILDVVQRTLLEHRRDLPLPTSFLIDGEGRLRVLYKGPVDVDALLADARGLEASPAAVRDAAVPFPGRWHGALFAADLALLEARLHEAGLEDAARELALERMDVQRRSPAEMQLEFGNARARNGDLEGALEHFRQATVLDPQSRVAWTSLGAARHQLGRVEEAVEAYETALLREPKHPDTLYNLALAYAYLGERETTAQLIELLDAIDAPLAATLRPQAEALGER